MVNFYELLGVKNTATKEEINKAYRFMMKKYHPDINKNEDAQKMSRAINEAKEILLNDTKRRDYDLQLEEIKYSKQYSSNKKETYREKTKKYQENYSQGYVTRWEIFIDYLKRSVDKTWVKIVKTILIIVNYLLFKIAKFLLLSLLFLVYFTEGFMEYVTGFLLLFAAGSLFLMSPDQGPDVIPFISGNIEQCLYFILITICIIIFSVLVKTKTGNVYVLIQDIQDKIFLKILSR